MKKEKYLDIVEALLKEENKNLFNPDFKGKFFHRKLIFQAYLKGKINFYEMFWNIMPACLRPKEILLNEQGLKISLVNHFFGNNYPLNPLNFLGYTLNYLPAETLNKREEYMCFFGLVLMTREIVVLDQYCARDFIKDNFVIIDAGANIGIFSLFAHYLSPNGKVYSFEPNTKTFTILKKNVIENNLSNTIRIFQQALGDKKGEATLMKNNVALETGNILAESEFLKGREKIFTNSETVLITTIDNLVEDEKIDKVDFIKIDAEGYEKQVIKGAKETIKNFSPIIACAAYHLKNDKEAIPNLIKSINPNYKYKIVKRYEDVLVFSIDI